MKNVILEESEEDKKNVKFAIRKGCQAKIYKHFLSLAANRKSFEGKPKSKEDPALLELQDTPHISEKSRMIAEENRKKYMNEASATDFVTHILEKDKVRNQKKLLDKKRIQEETEKNALQQSTFKPQTLNYKSNKKNVSHGDRCLDLYARAKFGCYAAKQNIPTDQIEFQKQKSECSHQP